MKSRVLVGALLMLLTGCAETGHRIWCAERYLPNLEKKPVMDNGHLRFAKHGYPYAVAASVVLERADDDTNYNFALPGRFSKILSREGSFGFEATAFDVKGRTESNGDEVVVAFTGSNDWVDWFFTNFLWFRAQYNQARVFVKEIAVLRPEKRLVVTGHSLGGALAVHVTKSPETGDLVSEAWAFSPSPKIWASSDPNPKIYLGAARGEILSSLRSHFFNFVPGISDIGALKDQSAEKFDLIRTTSIYGHYRWVVTRNMLHVADYATLRNGDVPNSEPLEILRQWHPTECSV